MTADLVKKSPNGIREFGTRLRIGIECDVDWFGERLPLQVITNEGRFPWLGTGLLEQRALLIDYRQKTVVLD